LHAAIACCLPEPSGSGEALMISSHTSRAATRVAPTLPLAAWSQMLSILVLVAADSVGIALALRLHDSTAEATAGVFAGLLVVAEEVVLAAGVLLVAAGVLL
jgi:hypothetical protein